MQIFLVNSLNGHSDKIANSMLSDDAEGMSNAHQSFGAAKKQIEEFSSHWGGNQLSDAGEDSCWEFEVQNPEVFLKDLESLQAHVQELSGNSMTIGIGQTLSDAGKSFLHAKISGTEGISIFEPSMEQDISQSGGEAEEAPVEQQPYYDDQEEPTETEEEFESDELPQDGEEGNSDVQNLPSDEDEVGQPDHEEDQGEVLPEQSEEGDFSNEIPHDEDQKEPVDQLDYYNDEGLEEEYKPFTDGAVANTSNVAIAGNELDATNNDIGRVAYKPAAELGAGDPRDGEIEIEEDGDPDEMEADGESYNEAAENNGEPENEDDNEFVEEAPLEESQESETVDIPDSKEYKELERQQTQDQEGNEAVELSMDEDAAGENDADENPDHYIDEDEDEYNDNELVNPEGEEEQEEEIPDTNMMGDAMEEAPIEQGSMEVADPNSEMPGEEQVMGDSMSDDGAADQEYDMANEMADEEQVGEELRDQIATALQGFQGQSEALHAMADQAPELYAATLVLLQTLVQMSNLIFGAEAQDEQSFEDEAGSESQEQPYYEEAPMEEIPAEEGQYEESPESEFVGEPEEEESANPQ